MRDTPGGPPAADDSDGLPDQAVCVPLDNLVAFLEDYFAAMDALRGPSAAGDAPAGSRS